MAASGKSATGILFFSASCSCCFLFSAEACVCVTTIHAGMTRFRVPQACSHSFSSTLRGKPLLVPSSSSHFAEYSASRTCRARSAAFSPRVFSEPLAFSLVLNALCSLVDFRYASKITVPLSPLSSSSSKAVHSSCFMRARSTATFPRLSSRTLLEFMTSSSIDTVPAARAKVKRFCSSQTGLRLLLMTDVLSDWSPTVTLTYGSDTSPSNPVSRFFSLRAPRTRTKSMLVASILSWWFFVGLK
mmetsp:Transcript_12920/g.33239  ORF Transcript_12920/g.33239 Transcript_12920/m.33239 type:complete len:244 (-) Transcript_12920:417-1148(-)